MDNLHSAAAGGGEEESFCDILPDVLFPPRTEPRSQALSGHPPRSEWAVTMQMANWRDVGASDLPRVTSLLRFLLLGW